MANIFVRSTDGSDADNGSTWALAKAKLSGATAIDAAGDTIYVSDNHSDTTAGAVTLALAGTYASPVRVLCVDDTADPTSPTTLATTGSVATTGANAISISGVGYIYGLTFDAGSTTSSANVNIATGDGDYIYAEQCTFICNGTGTSSRVFCGSTTSGTETRVLWKNCSVRFDDGVQAVGVSHCKFIWEGGSLLSGGTALPDQVLKIQANQADIVVSGCDFSAGAAGINLVGATALSAGTVIFRNCKLPTSWSGRPVTLTAANVRVEMWNCDASDTNYRMWIVDYFGEIKTETTIVRTGGASDGDTPISWKMISDPDAEYPMMVLRSPEILVRHSTTGSKTATIEIVHDSVTALTDAEVWLEVMYLGTSGFPLGVWASDAKTDVLASAASQATSTVTWTTTGITNVNKQKIAVTYTANEKGYAHLRVCLAKASYTVYACPKVDVT